MQALVKMPHIDIQITGAIPPRILNLLEVEYGENLKLIENEDDESMDAFETDWFKAVEKELSPASNMKFYRQLHHLTQEELGKRLGGIPKQHISNMENGKRPISKRTAKQLSQIFDLPLERFI
jgi:DNA-binding XRE family transcriptional regulator